MNFKGHFYPIEEIEAAVLYLEAFRGFKYRDRITTGRTNTTSDGDNNKISFRVQKEVLDFTFQLDYFSEYWSLKRWMTLWAERGINVYVEKVFEDDFIIQEMTNFNTPVSPTLEECDLEYIDDPQRQ